MTLWVWFSKSHIRYWKQIELTH